MPHAMTPYGRDLWGLRVGPFKIERIGSKIVETTNWSAIWQARVHLSRTSTSLRRQAGVLCNIKSPSWRETLRPATTPSTGLSVQAFV
jgi:hypothetical protein